MRIEQAVELILGILKTMYNGEIHLIIRKGEVKYINTLEPVKFHGTIEESESSENTAH